MNTLSAFKEASLLPLKMLIELLFYVIVVPGLWNFPSSRMVVPGSYRGAVPCPSDDGMYFLEIVGY